MQTSRKKPRSATRKVRSADELDKEIDEVFGDNDTLVNPSPDDIERSMEENEIVFD